MVEENKITTIAISPSTKEKLRNIGKMGQTDDELINQIVDLWNKYGGLVNKK